MGPALDPHAGFLLNRGIKTLGVRMAAHNENALQVARFLEEQSWVKKVYYPGLKSHPDHERAQKYLRGFGGMVSFDFNGRVLELERSFKKLELPKVAPSLGGVESLITRPSTTSHSGLSADEKARLGISDVLVRLSVGLEDPQDLIQDLQQAFSA
jgi:cystathionine gamma-synthase/cystathionine gamma-lyase/cystathionine beta-lyase